MAEQFYLVTANRSTVYRVKAGSAAEAEEMCLDDSNEVDGTTHSIKAEPETVEDAAKCDECGEVKAVCCDTRYVDNPDGTRTHTGAVCVDCCRGNHQGTPVWDGKCVAGGTFERCGDE